MIISSHDNRSGIHPKNMKPKPYKKRLELLNIINKPKIIYIINPRKNIPRIIPLAINSLNEKKSLILETFSDDKSETKS